MSRSPHSRGKGNRRVPGRPGGRGRAKSVGAWQRRAQHLVGAIIELHHPVMRLEYIGRYRDDAAHTIYLLDQAMARLRVKYFAEYRRCSYRTAAFSIYVSADRAPEVAAEIARLQSA